jgi:hypothetical protein
VSFATAEYDVTFRHSDFIRDQGGFGGPYLFLPTTYLTLNGYGFPSSNATAEYDVAFQHSDFISNQGGFGEPHDFMSASTTASGMNGFVSFGTQPSVAAFATSSVLTTGITTAVANGANARTNRLKCHHTGCSATFARGGDRRRHNKRHLPPQHPCPVDDCDRKGDRAFYRLDKLYDHQRKKHGMAV